MKTIIKMKNITGKDMKKSWRKGLHLVLVGHGHSQKMERLFIELIVIVEQNNHSFGF